MPMCASLRRRRSNRRVSKCKQREDAKRRKEFRFPFHTVVTSGVVAIPKSLRFSWLRRTALQIGGGEGQGGW